MDKDLRDRAHSALEDARDQIVRDGDVITEDDDDKSRRKTVIEHIEQALEALK
jgi:hypothetical protein